MRITPLDIRQKTFEKNFRGYEKDEVNAFLLTLSQEWERILDENRELRMKIEGIEREVTKLREVENSLYKTLKTAEDTGANVIEQARTAANLHLRESQIQAEGLLQEAKSKARDTIEESDSRAKEIIAEMEERLKLIVENYKMVEASREDLLANFKHIASDALDRVERSRNLTRDFDPDKHLAMVKREARRVAFPNVVDTSKSSRNESAPKRDKEVVLEDGPLSADQPPKKVQSFFDEIG